MPTKKKAVIEKMVGFFVKITKAQVAKIKVKAKKEKKSEGQVIRELIDKHL